MLTFFKVQSQALGIPYTVTHNSLGNLSCLFVCMSVIGVFSTQYGG
jgi:hypothetical protein